MTQINSQAEKAKILLFMQIKAEHSHINERNHLHKYIQVLTWIYIIAAV